MVDWPQDGYRLKSRARCNIINGSQATIVLLHEQPWSPHTTINGNVNRNIPSTSCKDCRTAASSASLWDRQNSIGRATPLLQRRMVVLLEPQTDGG
jgi:hypothetical protein